MAFAAAMCTCVHFAIHESMFMFMYMCVGPKAHHSTFDDD